MEPMWLVVGALITAFGLYEIVTHYKKDSPAERVDKLRQDKSSTKQGALAAGRQYKAAEARTNTTVQVTKETVAQLDLEKAPERHDRVIEVEKTLHENVVVVTSEATAQRVSPQAHDQIRTIQEQSRVKVDEHREMKEVDKQVYQFEKEIDVKGAIIARIAEHYEIEVLTEAFNRAVDTRQLLLLEPDSEARRQKLERLDKNIKDLDKAIDGKGQRLIQGDSRPKLGTGDED